MVNIFKKQHFTQNIYQYLLMFLYSISSISQYFTIFHNISQYTHQNRMVVRLPTLRMSLIQADPNDDGPDPQAAQSRSRNPNLSRNLRFLVGWLLHQPNGPGGQACARRAASSRRAS